MDKEIAAYQEIPEVRPINNCIVQRNHLQIKQDFQELIQEITQRLLSDPALSYLAVKKY